MASGRQYGRRQRGVFHSRRRELTLIVEDLVGEHQSRHREAVLGSRCAIDRVLLLQPRDEEERQENDRDRNLSCGFSGRGERGLARTCTLYHSDRK